MQEFNLTLGQSSGASVIPWVAGAVSGNIAGLGADAIVKKVGGGGGGGRGRGGQVGGGGGGGGGG